MRGFNRRIRQLEEAKATKLVDLDSAPAAMVDTSEPAAKVFVKAGVAFLSGRVYVNALADTWLTIPLPAGLVPVKGFSNAQTLVGGNVEMYLYANDDGTGVLEFQNVDGNFGTKSFDIYGSYPVAPS